MRKRERPLATTRNEPAAKQSSNSATDISKESSANQFSASLQQTSARDTEDRLNSGPTQNTIQRLTQEINASPAAQPKNNGAAFFSRPAGIAQRAPADEEKKTAVSDTNSVHDPEWDVLMSILESYNGVRSALEKEVFQVEAHNASSDSKAVTLPESLQVVRESCRGYLIDFQERASKWNEMMAQEESPAIAHKRDNLSLILDSLSEQRAELDDTQALAKRGKAKAEEASADEDWDVANEADSEGIQITLPSTEQFAKQTNAGVFSKRDNLLKQIDKALELCNGERKHLFSTETWLQKNANNPAESEGMKSRMTDSSVKGRGRYKGALNQVSTAISAWISQYKGDDSSSVAIRRGPIEALQQAVKSELMMTTDDRLQVATDKEGRDKAAADIESRTLFAADEFKTRGGIWVVIPTSNIADIISGLNAFHAIEDKPGDDGVRLRKLKICEEIREAASDENASIAKLKEHAGYEKGHTGFDKKSRATRQKTLWALMDRCTKYFLHNQTEEEKAERAAKVKAEIAAHNKAAYARWGITD